MTTQASVDQILRLLTEVRDQLPALVQQQKIQPVQIVTSEGLSDISRRLGLITAGEFRSGNGNDPGFGFSGVRIGYPAFAYAGDTYDFVGVNNDTLEVGISSDDGKLYFGEGTGVLNSEGIEIRASGLFINSNGYKFVDADNPNNIMGGLYSIVRHDVNDVYVELRAQPEDATLTTVNASVDAVAGSVARARLTADSGGYGGDASMLILLQTASLRHLYTSEVQTVSLDAAVDINASKNDLDFRVYGAAAAEPVAWVDAGFDRFSIGYDHYLPTSDASNPNVYFNEANEDMDFHIEGSTDEDLFFVDAGLDAIAIGGTGASSSYKLTVYQGLRITGAGTGATQYGLYLDTELSGSSQSKGLQFAPTVSTTVPAGGFYGIDARPYFKSTSGGPLASFFGLLGIPTVHANSTQNVTEAIGGYFRVDNSSGTSTISHVRSLNIANPSGGGTITNLYGIYINALTAGGTSNYSIYTNAGDVRLMNSSSDKIGFHGATPVAKQTVTGSRGGNAALASLLTALANLGLITNSTS